MLKFLKWLTVAVSVIAFGYGVYTLGWIQACGWVYSIAFAISAIPQAVRSIQDGHSEGVADGTMITWIAGEIFGLAYGIGLAQWPIIFNCAVNAIFVGIIIYYRVKPKENLMK